MHGTGAPSRTQLTVPGWASAREKLRLVEAPSTTPPSAGPSVIVRTGAVASSVVPRAIVVTPPEGFVALTSSKYVPSAGSAGTCHGEMHGAHAPVPP